MQKKKLIAAVMIMLIAVFGVGIAVGAATTSAEPGSVSDPLVTKSYLDQALTEVSGSGGSSASNTALTKKVDTLEKKVKTLETAAAKNGAFTRELLSKGQTLTATAGSEVILYSGGATVVTQYSAGVINLRTGKVAANKAKVNQYDTYLIAGKSSIKTTARSYVYVKGTYTIK